MKKQLFVIFGIVLSFNFAATEASTIFNIEVPATVSWTDVTFVNQSDIVQLSALGTWSGGWGAMGPDGIGYAADPENQWMPTENWGGLVGKIDKDYFYVGNGTTIISPTSGILSLTINDDASGYDYGDNWGSLMVTVNIIPEPATILLLTLGGLVLRKKR